MPVYQSVMAFDRICLRASSHLGNNWKSQLPAGAKAKLTPVDIPFSPNWPYEVDILQPDRATLQALKDLLGSVTQIEISYVEIARDYPVRFQVEAERLQLYFLRTATLRYGPKIVKATDNVYYYGDPKRSVRLALYADRPSKLATRAKGMPCLHTELRLQGAAAIRKAHLLTLDDLIHLNFGAFWNQHLSLWAFGNRARMGAALTNNRVHPQVTDNALRARVLRALSSDSYVARNVDVDGEDEAAKGPFVLQMLAAQHPSIKSSMRFLTATEWEKKARAAALTPTKWWR